jgi:D-arginine dehydrogenase
MPKKRNYDYLIAGAGLAGLSTAFFLMEKAVGADEPSVAVTDRESGPGLAASARSASMICQLVRDPVTCRLMIRSARLLREVWLKRYPDVGFTPCGSLHIGEARDIAAFAGSVAVARAQGVDVERLGRDAAVKKFPVLARTQFDEALWCPSDGIIDTDQLVWRLWQDLLARGVRFGFMASGAVSRTSDGFEAEMKRDNFLTAPVLVNAAGAWARSIADMAGASPLTAQPMRRHVFVTSTFNPPMSFPIIWDVTNEIYVRPDGAAVMTSPCDEQPSEAGPTGVSDEARELLEQKLKSFFPAILGSRHTRIWSGLRTFSKDRKFVIGWDAAQKNFFWTACLGGYGVTASAACGELAATLLTNSPSDAEFTSAFSPARNNLK